MWNHHLDTVGDFESYTTIICTIMSWIMPVFFFLGCFNCRLLKILLDSHRCSSVATDNHDFLLNKNPPNPFSTDPVFFNRVGRKKHEQMKLPQKCYTDNKILKTQSQHFCPGNIWLLVTVGGWSLNIYLSATLTIYVYLNHIIFQVTDNSTHILIFGGGQLVFHRHNFSFRRDPIGFSCKENHWLWSIKSTKSSSA